MIERRRKERGGEVKGGKMRRSRLLQFVARETENDIAARHRPGLTLEGINDNRIGKRPCRPGLKCNFIPKFIDLCVA